MSARQASCNSWSSGRRSSSKEDLAVLRDGKPLALRIGVEAMPDEPRGRDP